MGAGMQHAHKHLDESSKPDMADGGSRNETLDDCLNERPDRLLSWLDMAERYYREHAERQP